MHACMHACVRHRMSTSFLSTACSIHLHLNATHAHATCRYDVEGKGKTYKLKFLAAEGAYREAECPDNMYILDAAEQAGIDLPGEALTTYFCMRATRLLCSDPCFAIWMSKALRLHTAEVSLTHVCISSNLTPMLQPLAEAESAARVLAVSPKAQLT